MTLSSILSSSVHISLLAALLALGGGGGVGEGLDRQMTGQASCPHPDYDGLMALYNSTGGPSWTDNTGWVDGVAMTNCDPCSGWYGVRCNTNNRVDGLDMDGSPDASSGGQHGGNNMIGILPAVIELAELDYLFLDDNQIGGPMSDISGMPSLKSFSADDNLFTGNIPDFSALPSLSSLSLSGNSFEGTIPDFSNVPLLEEINLCCNDLSGEIPDFTAIPLLRTLFLLTNDLSGEIPDFSKIPMLSTLRLDLNDLSGEIPNFTNLPALVFFAVSDNNLDGAIPDFSNLPALEQLLLINNNLNGVIPDFSNVPLLWNIGFSNNQLNGSIPDFVNLPNLEYLFLNDNLLIGSIPELNGVTNLVVVQVQTNNLSGCYPLFTCSIPSFASFSNSLLPFLGNYSEVCDNALPQIAAPCNDSDPNTENDQIQADCSCAGTVACPSGTTVTVTTTADSGPGSLREAIDCANADVDLDVIEFSLPNGSIINLLSSLPTITDPGISINGMDAVTLDGSGMPVNDEAITIQDAPNVEIIQLRFQGLRSGGIYAANCASLRIENCSFTNPEIGNTVNAIFVSIVDNASISGNTSIGENNGVYVEFSDGASVTGNTIYGSSQIYIGIETCSNIMISGNTLYQAGGVGLTTQRGIYVDNSVGVTIGDGANYIGQCQTSIEIAGGSSTIIRSNGIGADAFDTEIGAGTGVFIHGGNTGALIENNSIGYGDLGIEIATDVNGVSITENRMFCLETQGIDIIGAGNNNVVVPEISSATTGVVRGTGATPGDVVEIYSVNTCAGNTICQGGENRGLATVQTDLTWEVFPMGLVEGDRITAILTDAGNNSSEFATCVEVTQPCPTISPATTLSSCFTFDLTQAEPELTNGQAGVTVNWYEDGVLIPPANRTNYSPPTGAFTIEAEVDDSNCTSDREEVTLTVTPSPSFSDPSLPATACEGEMIDVTMTISGGNPPYNGLFQIGMNTLNTMTNFGGGTYSFSFTLPVGAYDYSMAEFGSLSDADGCQTVMGTGNDANLTVLALPTATAPAIAPRCDDGLGNTIDLTQFDAQVGSGTVSWFEDALGNNQIGAPTSHAVGGTSTTLFARVENNGCSSELVAISVDIDAAPAIFAATNLTSCDGTYDLTFAETELTGGAGGVFVNWYNQGGDIIGDPTAYDAAGANFVRAEVSDGNCASPQEDVSLSVPAGGFLSISQAVLPTGICAGEEITVTVEIGGGTAPYSGSFAAGNEVLNSFFNFDGGDYTFTFSLPAGSYATDFFGDVQDAGSCFASNSAVGGTLVIRPIPATGQPSPAPVCFNGTDNVIDLTQYDAELGGGAQVQWFTNEQGTVPVGNPMNIEFERGTTTVYGSVTMDGCTAIQSVSFEVFDAPELTLACELSGFATLGNNDGAISLTFAGGTPPYASVAYTGAATGEASNTGSFSSLADELGEGTYFFTIEDALACTAVCSFTLTTEAANTCDPERDSLVLLDIYNTTDGPNWVNLDDANWADGANWLQPNVPLADWDGITLSPEGCVTILDLDGGDNDGETIGANGIGMDGSLEGLIGQLRNLDSLYLTSNFDLDSSIPEDIYTMNNLKVLFMDNIGLDNPVSANIANMVSLSSFIADYNQFGFDDVLPAQAAFSAIRDRGGFVVLSPQDSIYAGSYHELDAGQPLSVDLGREVGDNQKVYRWYRNNVLEQEVTGGTGLLSFATLEPADAGLYFAQVSHPDVTEFELLARAVEVVVNEPLATCIDGILNGNETGLDCGGPDCPACACAHPDYTPLMALYTSTNGDGWTFNGTNDDPSSTTAGWGKDCDVCDWYGVFCDGNRVAKIDLDGMNNEETDIITDGNNLDGPLPLEIGLLDELRTLSLSNNDLTGPIPREIGQLTNLISLGMRGCQLSDSLPPEIGALTRLKYCLLVGNNLTGNLPPEIGQMVDLEYLLLNFNQLSGAIPPQIGDLKKCLWLYLFSNNLTGEIPPSIGEMDRLRYLYLHSNGLEGIIPDEIGNLDTLQRFYAFNNELTGNISDSIFNSRFLSEILLQSNNLEGEIPSGAGSLTFLRGLFFQNNMLSGCLPEDLSVLCQLGFNDGTNAFTGGYNLLNNSGLPFEGDYTQVCDNALPQIGAPCNDGNPDTENDTIDADCNCVGTSTCPTVDVELTGENANGVLGSEVCFTIMADTFPDLNRLSFSVNFPDQLLGYTRFVSLSPAGESSVSTTELADGNLGVTWEAGLNQSYTDNSVSVIELCFEVLSVEEAVVNLTNRPAGISAFVMPDCVLGVVASTFAIINEDVAPTCADGIMNGNETGLDCGGPDCPACACPNGNRVMVTNNNDAGPGSLREAINCANADADLDEIRFDATVANSTIMLVSELPEIMDTGISIDAENQGVVIDGTNLTAPDHGVHTVADDVTVARISVINFPESGVSFDRSSGVMVDSCIFNNNAAMGVRVSLFSDDISISNSSFTDNGVGVQITQSDDFRVENNVFVSNGQGVASNLSSNGSIDGNMVGQSGSYAIRVSSSNDMSIGLNSPNYVYSGGGSGITLWDTCRNVLIQNNFIGMNPNMEEAGNSSYGVDVIGASRSVDVVNNTIAFNGLGALNINDGSDSILISQNQMICNANIGTQFNGSVNQGIDHPVITLASTNEITGTAFDNAMGGVELYLVDNTLCGENTVCQGSEYIGTAAVDGDGFFTFTPATALNVGDRITSLSTDPSGVRSSYFSFCHDVVAGPTCTDGIMNGNETGLDCGGPDCPECACEHPDYAPLMALYNTTNGDNWIHNGTNMTPDSLTAGWGKDCNVCDWYGVRCNTDDRVETLDLDGNLDWRYSPSGTTGNNLNGFLPAGLGGLTELEILVITLNPELRGEIPSELGQLANLRELHLVSDSLTGPIPEELCALTALTNLQIRNMELSGELPPCIGAWTNIRNATIGNSNITGPIPSGIGDWTQVGYLNFNANELTGEIPPEIGNLKLLGTLFLSGNNLRGNIPPEIGGLSSIGNISIRDNELTGAIPDSMYTLSTLNALDLRTNELSGEISPRVSEMTNLTILLLGSNGFTGTIPPELGDISLNTLDLSITAMTGTIPGAIAQDSLRGINLRINDFEGCIPPEFFDKCGLSVNFIANPKLPWEGDFSMYCATDGTLAAQVGAPCNDGNPETVGETIQEDCSCRIEIPCPDIFPAGPLQLCAAAGASFDLTALDATINGSTAGVDVLWFDDEAATNPILAPQNYEVVATATVYARTDNGNCRSDSIPVLLELLTPPELVCIATDDLWSVSLLEMTVAPYQVTIRTPSAETTNQLNSPDGEIQLAEEGQYAYIVTDALGCMDSCFVDYTPITCNDGIQNGQETGVDCGGPDCAPCTCVIAQMIDTTLCKNDQLVINGVIYDDSNPTGTDIIVTPGACDTIMTIDLDFYPSAVPDEDFRDLCAGDTIFVDGSAIFEDFTGTIIIPNRFGCDSVELLLDVVLVTTDTINQMAGLCPGDTLDFFGQSIVDTGRYSHYEPAVAGNCDALYQLEVTAPTFGRSLLLNDSFQLLRSDEFIELNILDNDSLAEGALIIIDEPPTKGRLTGNQVLGYRYRPDGEYIGRDSFLYQVCLPDCPEICEEATVHFTIDFDCLVELQEKLPNAITPNGDGKNDVFDPQNYNLPGCDFSLMKLHIYTRWGQRIFSPTVYQAWPGTDNIGRPLGADTYFYVMEVEGVGEVRGEIDIILRE